MAKSQKVATGDMENFLDKLSKLDLMENKLSKLDIMERKLEKLEKLDKLEDKLEDLQRSLLEIKTEMAVTKKDLNVVQVMAKETKEKVDGLEGGMRAARRREEERGNVLLNLQLQKMAYFLRFQNVEEVAQENLREVMVKLLQEYTSDDLGWDIDQVYRVNTLYATTHGVPREVHVKFVRRETREVILRRQREQALQYRGREITILKQIPRQVREARRKYHFLSNKLYLKGVGFRWLMPEGLVIFWEGIRKRINNVAEAKAYMEEHKTLLEAEATGVEEGEVLDVQEVGAGAAVDDPGGGQIEPRALRSRTKK